MTRKEQDTQLVQLAIQQTAALLMMLHSQDADFIIRELFFNAWSKFKEHQRRLHKLEIFEIADSEYIVRANGHAESALLIEQKNGSSKASLVREKSGKRAYKPWTTLQIKFLKENYNTLTVEQIGQRLERNRDSIFYMAQKLGLKKDPEFFSRSKRKGGADA